MTNAKNKKELDLTRREALERLGLAVGAVYMTPMLLSLSNAQASSTSSGGDDNSGSDSDNSGSGSDNSGSGSGGNSGPSSASTPSSPGEDDDDDFSGDPTPAGGNLSSDEELWLIQNGWQKATHK